MRCPLHAEETASCLPDVAYVFLSAGVAPAVKADDSMVHFGARQLAWSRRCRLYHWWSPLVATPIRRVLLETDPGRSGSAISFQEGWYEEKREAEA